MLDVHGIIRLLRLITSASSLTMLSPCYTIHMPALLARDESQQPSRRNRAGFVLLSEDMMTPIVRPASVRFWEKVDQTGDCWVWLAHKDHAGYGQFTYESKTIRSHRVSWMLTHGEIPNGLFVCHKCDNPSCVRPDHLFLGTHSDNMRDSYKKGRKVLPERTRFVKGRQGRRGEESYWAKLTSDQVVEIRQLYEQGSITQEALAQRYGVNRTTVRDIINRRNWKHV
jgi:hypothetical protein